MTNAAISNLYTSYKRFVVSRVQFWKPKIYQNLVTMVTNATDAPTIEAAIKNLDYNMLRPSGIAETITNIYKDAGRVWGGKIYQLIKQQGDKLTRRAQNKKAMMPIGDNNALVAEIVAYFRLNLLNTAVLPISDTMKAYILEQLILGQQNGLSLTAVTNNILQSDFPKNRALVITRTETIKAANFGGVAGAKKSNYQSEKIWIAANDQRTRRIPRDEFSHLAMNGKTAPLDTPFLVPNRNGSVDALQQPGDPHGAGGDVIQCRCTCGFNVLRGANGLPLTNDL